MQSVAALQALSSSAVCVLYYVLTYSYQCPGAQGSFEDSVPEVLELVGKEESRKLLSVKE